LAFSTGFITVQYQVQKKIHSFLFVTNVFIDLSSSSFPKNTVWTTVSKTEGIRGAVISMMAATTVRLDIFREGSEGIRFMALGTGGGGGGGGVCNEESEATRFMMNKHKIITTLGFNSVFNYLPK
jgi:hypothetical protein